MLKGKAENFLSTIRNCLKSRKKGGAYTVEIAAIVLIVLLVCVVIAADRGSGGIGGIWTNMKAGINSAITKATAHFE